MTYTFALPVSEQLSSIDHAVSLLRAFHAAHPDAPDPWYITTSPAIYYMDTSILKVRDYFGRQGWTAEAHIIWRVIDGVRIECRIPQRYTKPFSFEEVEG